MTGADRAPRGGPWQPWLPRRLRTALPIALIGLATLAGRVGAQPHAGDVIAFPGDHPSPASAVTAGLALADRWLATEPFDNPAVRVRLVASLSPIVHRVSRQDLRALSSEYADTVAFIDAAGGFLGYALPRSFTFCVYANQPVLRREKSSFVAGEVGGPVPPASVRFETESREMRVGLAVAWRRDRYVVGAAPEWTRREDRYEVIEETGALVPETSRLDVSGEGVGFQLGARGEFPSTDSARYTVSLAARFVPELTIEGSRAVPGGSDEPVDARREAAWEGGIGLAARVSEAVHVIAGAGGRTASAWEGLGVESGRSAEFSIAVEYADPEAPWTARLGLGRESHEGSLEPQAGRIGIGFGWSFGAARVDAAVLRRSLERSSSPTSYDDRLLVSVTLGR